MNVKIISNNNEIGIMFMNFVAFIDRQFNNKINKIQSDNNNEFNCPCDYLKKHSIGFETLCIETPKPNWKLEQKH